MYCMCCCMCCLCCCMCCCMCCIVLIDSVDQLHCFKEIECPLSRATA